MKYSFDKRVCVELDNDLPVPPFRNYDLREKGSGEVYRFSCGLLLPPEQMPYVTASAIYVGNYGYEDPEDHRITHYKHALLYIRARNPSEGWLDIYNLEVEPRDFVQELDWEQFSALFPLSPQ